MSMEDAIREAFARHIADLTRKVRLNHPSFAFKGPAPGTPGSGKVWCARAGCFVPDPRANGRTTWSVPRPPSTPHPWRGSWPA